MRISLIATVYGGDMRSATQLILACLLSFLLGAQSIAARVSDRELVNLWQQGDVLQMRKLATSGDVRAQRWLGRMLHNRGRYDEAIHWYSRAVENGDAKSANRIAFFYEHGIGRAKNAKEALTWHRRAALLGDFASQLSYAAALRQGDVLPRDDREAFRWYTTAAAQRDYTYRGYAYLPIAEMYKDGVGVGRDLTRSYAYAKAADLTVDESDNSSRDKASSLRFSVARQLSPAELAAGEQLYRTIVADVLERRKRRLTALLKGASVLSLLGLGFLLLVKGMRRRSGVH